MRLTGLHLLLTYQCNYACDHCFVWGGPGQTGTMTLGDVSQILEQARDLGTVESISFEGGEPFLYYATLLEGVRTAVGMGFRAGIVTNVYWATSDADAEAALRPFVGLISDISISSDLFHCSQRMSREARSAIAAAEKLGISTGVISVAQPGSDEGVGVVGELPPGESAVMVRGRAAKELAGAMSKTAWSEFVRCPHEDLRDPGRVHVDPLGHLHVCQGITMGNLFRRPLVDIVAEYDPDAHSVVGPLLRGGPAELVRNYGLPHAAGYADACHLCYEARLELRERFPDVLGPDQMYGGMEAGEVFCDSAAN